MRGWPIRLIISGLAVAVILAIVLLLNTSGPFGLAGNSSVQQTQIALQTRLAPVQGEAQARVLQPFTRESSLPTAHEGIAAGVLVGVAGLFSVLAALAGGWLGRLLLIGKIRKLRKEVDDIRGILNSASAKVVDNRLDSAGAVSAQSVNRAENPTRVAGVPRSIPNSNGGVADPSAQLPSVEPRSASLSQPLRDVSPAMPLVDPAKEQQERELLRQNQADQALKDFQSLLQQFLAGTNVSQKAFDLFIRQFGQAWLVKGIDGGHVHRALDATGTETLLALQLAGHDRVILMPSFYFISDFSSSFAKIGDVPRDIKAAFDIKGAGNGQLQINRLGLLEVSGPSFVLTKPRGELAGFID